MTSHETKIFKTCRQFGLKEVKNGFEIVGIYLAAGQGRRWSLRTGRLT